MQSTLSQQGGYVDGVTLEAVPALALVTSGLGSHVWLASLLASVPWPERPDSHGERVALKAVLEDRSHVGSWAFPGGYSMKSERLASGAVPQDSSLQEALQAL